MITPPPILVILDSLYGPLASLIRAQLPALDIRDGNEVVTEPCAVITFSAEAALDRYTNMVWAHCAGAGVNGIFEALQMLSLPPPPLMTRTVGRMGQQIGEYVLSYLLADAQKHDVRRQLQADRNWNNPAAAPRMIAGRQALILGTGGIGAGVAQTLEAVGVHCVGVSRSGQKRDPFSSVVRLDDLRDMSDIDLVVGALPLTAKTENRIDERVFDHLNQALFINVGRGATADIGALKAALASGHLRHAVLDVQPEEPLPPESDLWSWPGITVTPHVSGLTQYEDTVVAFVSAYQALEAGKTPDLVVDVKTGY